MSASDVHVALLRGINVGGKNGLPMKELARLFTAAGCSDVSTYIQSGNVVFRAKPALARKIAAAIAAEVKTHFGFHVPVVTRTLEELRKVVRDNPYLRSGAEPQALHVMFLSNTPAKSKIAALDPKRSPPDQFSVRGRDIYLHCPSGIGRSKLTNDYFDSKLGTISTARNWRTVSTLLDLATACGSKKL